MSKNVCSFLKSNPNWKNKIYDKLGSIWYSITKLIINNVFNIHFDSIFEMINFIINSQLI